MKEYEQDVYFLLIEDFDELQIRAKLTRKQLAKKIIAVLEKEFSEFHKELGGRVAIEKMYENLTWQDRIKIHEFKLINKLLLAEPEQVKEICTDKPFQALIVTELAGIMHDEEIAAATDNLKYVCYKDERTCNECWKRDGKIYTKAEAKKIDFHPRCRCLLIPV